MLAEDRLSNVAEAVKSRDGLPGGGPITNMVGKAADGGPISGVFSKSWRFTTQSGRNGWRGHRGALSCRGSEVESSFWLGIL